MSIRAPNLTLIFQEKLQSPKNQIKIHQAEMLRAIGLGESNGEIPLSHIKVRLSQTKHYGTCGSEPVIYLMQHSVLLLISLFSR